MRFLGTFLLFGGYMLIYAAIAGGGKFATEPWMGLLADAYTELPIVNPVQGGSGPKIPGLGSPFTIPGFGPVQPLTPNPPGTIK